MTDVMIAWGLASILMFIICFSFPAASRARTIQPLARASKSSTPPTLALLQRMVTSSHRE